MQLKHIDHSRYDKAISFEQLLIAANECATGVNWKSSVINWIFEKELRCAQLHFKLKTNTYKLAPYLYFNLKGPKPRLISSTKFTDRVVQRSLCNNGLYEMISKPLIYDNGACLNNKGLQFVFNRFKNKLQKYINTHNDGYVVKCDIKKFFDSTPHTLLKNYIKKYITENNFYIKICEIIDSFKDFRSYSDILLDKYDKRGIGLGSQISQLLMLLYLNDIDHAIYQKFKNSTYVRYMDDIIFICETKEIANNTLNFISNKLSEKGLELNNKTKIQNIHDNFTFLKVNFKISGKKINIHMNRKTISKEVNKLSYMFESHRDIKIICNQYNSWIGSNKYKMSKGQLKFLNNKFKQIYMKWNHTNEINIK